MSSVPQKVNTDAVQQPPARGGFIRIFRDELPALYHNKSAALVMLWLKGHAAFVHQEMNRRGELIKLAPGECVFSLLDLQKSLGLTPKEARYALEYLNKNDLIRLVTAKNYSKVIFPESNSWAACAKYMCKTKPKNKFRKRGTDGSTDQDTDQGMDHGTDKGILLDKNNYSISDGYDKNGSLRGTDQGADRGTDQDTDQGADEGKAGAHIGLETPAMPGLPTPKNSEKKIPENKSLSSSNEREDFFSKFKGMERSIEDQFHRQFKVRVEIKSELQVKAALSMLFQARRCDKHFDSPAGLFIHIAGGAGSYIIPDNDWDPFGSVAVSSFSPPREVAELARAAAERTSPERLAEIKKEAEEKRKAVAGD